MADNEGQTSSRRSFLKQGGLVAGVAAAGTLAAPAVVTAQAPRVLRMQAAWPSGDIFFEMAGQYAARVEAMSGGRLRIDLLPAGSVVGAFQVMEAVSDGIVDAGLPWAETGLPGAGPRQYLHPAADEQRPEAGAPDLGAYEYVEAR